MYDVCYVNRVHDLILVMQVIHEKSLACLLFHLFLGREQVWCLVFFVAGKGFFCESHVADQI